MSAPTPLRPAALAAALRPRAVGGTRLAVLLGGEDGPGAFRRLVRLVFPAEEAAIMGSGADSNALDREAARVDAFISRFARRHFPLYEQCEYIGLLGRIPFVLFGWASDEFHALEERHPGHLLMLALVEDVYPGYRVAALERLADLGIPGALLVPLAEAGVPRDELRRRLTDGPFGAVCDFADWVHGDTGRFFLDCCDEYEIDDNIWCPEVIDHLTGEWRRAEVILDRIDAVRRLLEAVPARAFADLMRAVGLPTPDDPAAGDDATRSERSAT